jgi:hypothetical protein
MTPEESEARVIRMLYNLYGLKMALIAIALWVAGFVAFFIMHTVFSGAVAVGYLLLGVLSAVTGIQGVLDLSDSL